MLVSEIERLGIPAVCITAMSSIAKAVGNGRIQIGGRIPYMCSDASLPLDREMEYRRKLVKSALDALTTKVIKPTIFTP